ncbi:MAG: sigma-70 family RNA polymerase sigma factor [Oscillospiraceae bacterium]|nr:sigma-70 family RNA polymerase sigma factor [Oscillospiraceae bacterium]
MSADNHTPRQRPPPNLRERDAAVAALTEEQRRFATENHNLIYAFLRDEQWDASEYYDIAALGFLRAVLRYFSDARLKKYGFSTIAWRNMYKSVKSHLSAEAHRRESEERYMELRGAEEGDPYEEMEYNLILRDLLAQSSERQGEMAALRLQGYSVAEIAAKSGMSAYRVRKLLKELFQAYLSLYRTDEKKSEDGAHGERYPAAPSAT